MWTSYPLSLSDPRAARGSLTAVMHGWAEAIRAISVGELAQLHLASEFQRMGMKEARANSNGQRSGLFRSQPKPTSVGQRNDVASREALFQGWLCARIRRRPLRHDALCGYAPSATERHNLARVQASAQGRRANPEDVEEEHRGQPGCLSGSAALALAQDAR